MLNKAQDAIVELTQALTVRVAALIKEGMDVSAAVEKAVGEIAPEAVEALNKLDGVFDAAKATLQEIRQTAKGVDINVTTPSGGGWRISVRQHPQQEA